MMVTDMREFITLKYLAPLIFIKEPTISPCPNLPQMKIVGIAAPIDDPRGHFPACMHHARGVLFHYFIIFEKTKILQFFFYSNRYWISWMFLA